MNFLISVLAELFRIKAQRQKVSLVFYLHPAAQHRRAAFYLEPPVPPHPPTFWLLFRLCYKWHCVNARRQKRKGSVLDSESHQQNYPSVASWGTFIFSFYVNLDAGFSLWLHGGRRLKSTVKANFFSARWMRFIRVDNLRNKKYSLRCWSGVSIFTQNENTECEKKRFSDFSELSHC